jgi:hypothetical protein
MFTRWHKRQRQSWRRKIDVHWGVALIEAMRVGGKPRQRHVAYLGSIRSPMKIATASSKPKIGSISISTDRVLSG